MKIQEAEAAREAMNQEGINPKFSLDDYAKILSRKDQSEIDKVVNALRKAGLK